MPDEKICIASSDGHVGPPTAVYKDYLEKRLHRAFDEYLANHTWLHRAFDEYLANHTWVWAVQSKDSFFPATFNAKLWGTDDFDPEHGSPVAWDPRVCP
jgi:hypothetical protein